MENIKDYIVEETCWLVYKIPDPVAFNNEFDSMFTEMVHDMHGETFEDRMDAYIEFRDEQRKKMCGFYYNEVERWVKPIVNPLYLKLRDFIEGHADGMVEGCNESYEEEHGVEMEVVDPDLYEKTVEEMYKIAESDMKWMWGVAVSEDNWGNYLFAIVDYEKFDLFVDEHEGWLKEE